jgi:hypothetical protein
MKSGLSATVREKLLPWHFLPISRCRDSVCNGEINRLSTDVAARTVRDARTFAIAPGLIEALGFDRASGNDHRAAAPSPTTTNGAQ